MLLSLKIDERTKQATTNKNKLHARYVKSEENDSQYCVWITKKRWTSAFSQEISVIVTIIKLIYNLGV